jgi:dipeptidase E
MRLFLASEAKNPESIEKLKKFVGKPLDQLKIVYIPTANNSEVRGTWKQGESVKVANSLTPNFKIVELEESINRDITNDFDDADIVWVAGGLSGYLLYWMRRSKFDRLLPKLLDKGVVYVGSSAGSMVTGKTLQTSEWFIGEEEPGVSLIPGLGLVDFEIYPHYEDELYNQINNLWKKGTLYLLKNGEVITVDGDKVEVLGEERKIVK